MPTAWPWRRSPEPRTKEELDEPGTGWAGRNAVASHPSLGPRRRAAGDRSGLVCRATLTCRGAHPELLAVHGGTLARADLEPVVEVLLRAGARGAGRDPPDAVRKFASSRPWKRSWKSSGAGTRRNRSKICWCKWPKPPRGWSKPTGPAFFCGTGRRINWSGVRRWGSAITSCGIPDSVGIVGRVIATGQPQRLDRADDPATVNRQVDSSIGYQTRTLLCVPLRGS